MPKFPLSGVVTRGTQKLPNYTFATEKLPSTMEEKSKFGKIILHPSLQRRIEHLARATANTKSHEAPFCNKLFYGPPGIGKTLVARERARKLVCII
ncbi:hypothetical protein L2E82_45707 [Cichorium intybus]|uniref:Uncharacterized protein n=1 Tax=Cichorium intybus TaxID=13427 RepID=A0ACB8ZUP6_CICIN|nr:hypothetical protein L2E82_45707 [Cichorium intybus]